jgi:peptidoglycan/xylan/chitin deacetylase (PgdA/CDA1 family)
MGALRALRELGVSFAQADVLVLCYHAVRTRERFAAQLSGLAARGYSVLSMQHFTEWLRGTTSVRTPAALLTFDGGYAEQLDNAVPVLERLGFPATFFLISSDLEADGPGIRRRDVAALTAAGHTVGCHSHTHPDLTRLPDDELEREVLGSKRRLEQALGHRVGAFCYPDGAHDARVVAADPAQIHREGHVEAGASPCSVSPVRVSSSRTWPAGALSPARSPSPGSSANASGTIATLPEGARTSSIAPGASWTEAGRRLA